MIIQDFVILILFNRHLLLVMTLNIIHDIFSLSNVVHSKGDKFITFDIKFIGMGQVSILLGHALNNQYHQCISKIFPLDIFTWPEYIDQCPHVFIL